MFAGTWYTDLMLCWVVYAVLVGLLGLLVLVIVDWWCFGVFALVFVC